MASKKEMISEVKEESKKKTNANKATSSKKVNSTKKTTSTSAKKGTTSKKSNNKSGAVKKSSSKKTTTQTKKVNTNTKKESTIPKKTEDKVKDITLVDVFAREKNIDFSKELKNTDNISKQEEIEQNIIEEINNVNVAKLEQSKFTKKKNKKLLLVGVFVVILGIMSLIVSLIANRIVDREFLSDSAITLMMAVSLIIEGFGAFIIINES